ncbi:hypothetical protein V8B55DRAFT_1042271 [Mucor lusitanicus]|uniref:Uncharacterized protein n=1 Tax=Mucor circinelloides f. lusitanicus TaxID=29924 RepID=A0A8H4F217_MUCCL|nr:hypothetical protein FB192DRAFT_1376191 [Mucor lusitanicus]
MGCLLISLSLIVHSIWIQYRVPGLQPILKGPNRIIVLMITFISSAIYSVCSRSTKICCLDVHGDQSIKRANRNHMNIY